VRSLTEGSRGPPQLLHRNDTFVTEITPRLLPSTSFLIIIIIIIRLQSYDCTVCPLNY